MTSCGPQAGGGHHQRDGAEPSVTQLRMLQGEMRPDCPCVGLAKEDFPAGRVSQALGGLPRKGMGTPGRRWGRHGGSAELSSSLGRSGI